MLPAVSPKLAARMWIVVVTTAIFSALGFVAGPPNQLNHWLGRAGIVVFGLFAIPAIYLTARSTLRVSSIFAMILAFGGAAAMAWVWIVRWLQ